MPKENNAKSKIKLAHWGRKVDTEGMNNAAVSKVAEILDRNGYVLDLAVPCGPNRYPVRAICSSVQALTGALAVLHYPKSLDEEFTAVGILLRWAQE